MALFLVRRLLMSKHLSCQRPSRKMLRLEECITIPFKIILNISAICKTIKIKIPSRKPNCYKGETKAISEGTKTTKESTKNTHKREEQKQSKKHKTVIAKIKRKRWGCHQRRKMEAPLNNTHTRED